MVARFYVLTGLFFTLLKDLAHMLIYERGALFQIHGISQNIDFNQVYSNRSAQSATISVGLVYMDTLVLAGYQFSHFSRLIIRKTKSLT